VFDWYLVWATYDPNNPEKPTGSRLFGGGSGGEKDPESGNGGPPIKF